MHRRGLFSIAAIIFCGFLIAASAWAKPPKHAHNRANRADTIVQTDYGRLMGDVGAFDTYVWKGVPYAKPPVRELRWQAPEDPEPWNGVRQAKKECVPCTQLATSDDWERQDYAVGSEDCLYLNIWRPQSEEQDLPVYVYIHGGSNNFGQAAAYNGSVIARRSNVVVVIIQYRLGPLGWFTHPALRNGDPLDDSGNYGTLDTIKALDWIQQNIDAFGGDPDNVLVSGESAGAHNTMNLVISPLAAGKFHKAMSQSGGMSPITVEEGIELANSTIDRLLVEDDKATDMEDAADIRNSMTDEEIRGYLMSKTSYEIYEVLAGNIDSYSAYMDGVVVPGPVAETISSGNYNKVPIILGANQYEYKSFLPLYGPAFGLPWDNLRKVLTGEIDSVATVLPSQNHRDLYELCGWYGSRSWRAKYVDRPAEALAANDNQPVYAYQFNWDGFDVDGANHDYWDGWNGLGSQAENFGFIYGAGHAMEIPFFFGSETSLWGFSFSPGNDTAGRIELQDKMMRYLANFAHFGNPNGSTLPEWQQWNNDSDGPKAILFDADYAQSQIEMDYEKFTLGGIQIAYMTDLTLRKKENFTFWDTWGILPFAFIGN